MWSKKQQRNWRKAKIHQDIDVQYPNISPELYVEGIENKYCYTEVCVDFWELFNI